MAQSVTDQAINSELLVQLDITKQVNKQAQDHSTLSTIYLLSDSADKAQKAAAKSQGLGSSAPAPLGSGDDPTSDLTPAQIQELKNDMALLQTLEQAMQDYENNPSGANEQKVQAALAAIMAGHQNMYGFLQSMNTLIADSGDSALQAEWKKACGDKTGYMAVLEACVASGTISSDITYFMFNFEADTTRQKDITAFNDVLNSLSGLVNDLKPKPKPGPTPPHPQPTPPSGPKVGDMLSFKELFRLMMKLMDSQQAGQTADANIGSSLSKQESAVIKQMASSLQKYYNNVVAKADKTHIGSATAQMNLYKTEWDNFKDQVDSQVQNQTTAAGTTDVNNIQQTSDFEKDVLQTWGNVASQLASL